MIKEGLGDNNLGHFDYDTEIVCVKLYLKLKNIAFKQEWLGPNYGRNKNLCQ